MYKIAKLSVAQQQPNVKPGDLMKKPVWFFFLASISSFPVTAMASSQIEINGEPTEVLFNDGDTFRILSGPLRGKRSRVAGFNTLESYGPVHRWGSFKKEALLDIAEQATQNARRDGWHCTTDSATDIYGRLLSTCMDLAAGQVRNGLAHVMTVTSDSGDPLLLELQWEAIQEKRGMWSKGVPEYILTSLHSIDETSNQKETYNRFVSTIDGHSVVESHRAKYKDCEEVCETPKASSREPSEKSCMTYVSFNNRFGPRRAECLKTIE